MVALAAKYLATVAPPTPPPITTTRALTWLLATRGPSAARQVAPAKQPNLRRVQHFMAARSRFRLRREIVRHGRDLLVAERKGHHVHDLARTLARLEGLHRAASVSSSSPMIDGIPLSRPSRRWQDAQVAASWAPRSLSAAELRSATRITRLAAIESAMIWRILGALSSRRRLAVTRAYLPAPKSVADVHCGAIINRP